jgi:outer membrane receptor protein involved in Fe transport
MQNRARLVVMAVLVLGFAVGAAFGQAITGTLVGTVLDSSGAVIAGASVVAKNLDTAVTYNTTTGSEGFYTVSNLPPGRYDVTVQAKGFKTGLASGNVVNVESTTRVDFTLSAGALTETVEVTGQAPLVESTTSDIGTLIDTKQVDRLPINGRLFQLMVFLVPGATPQAWGDQDENPAASGSTLGGGPGNGSYASVNGFFFAGNNFMVDGVHNNEPANDYLVINTPFADIQEMRIDTSNPNAEYGTFGGAVVNLTTKSGTNQVHGQAFEYVRNNDFNATDSFALTKAPYHANQFGAAIGGPIIKDKLFFFGDVQYLTQHAGQTYEMNVPTPAELGGDLSALAIKAGGTGPISNATACQIIANANFAATGAPQVGVPCTASAAVTVPGTYDTVPSADINPIVNAIASGGIFPVINNPGGSSNAIYNTVNGESVPQFDARVDYAYSEHDRFFARESYLHRHYTSPAPGTEFMMGSNPNAQNANHSAVIAWDHIFSGTMTNQLRIGFNRYVTNDFVDSFGVNENNTLGILNGNLAGIASTSGVAEFNFQNINLTSTGDPGPIPNGLGRLANIFEYSDGLTKVMGRHTLKFGTDIQHIQGGVANPQNDPRGCFSFNGDYTGNTLGDFLVGGPGGGGCPGGGGVERDLFIDLPHVRFNFLGFYAQDDIRINNELTLNVGLRYDIYTTPVSVTNTQSNFLTNGPDAGLIQLATGNNRSPNVDTYYKNFGPRIGIAYSPDNGKTALRAAFGLSYFPDNFGADSGTLERNYPELIQENFLSFNEPTNGCTLFGGVSTAEFTSCGSLIMANGFPGVAASANSAFYPLLVPPTTSGGPCLTGAGVNIASMPAGFVCPPNGSQVYDVEKNFRQDEAYSWNISVQRQITRDMSAQIAYVGNEGSHLFHDYQLNQCYPPELGLAAGTGSSPFTNYPNCLPYPALIPSGPAAGSLILTGVHARNSNGESRYNALEIEVQKRTSIGLTLQASYTFSRLLDNVDNPISAYDTSLQLVGEGWKNGNYPQNFVISYAYDLPFGTGRRYMSDVSGPAKYVVSGWQVSGITTFRSGGALLINAPGNLLPPGADQEVANFICGSGSGPSVNNPHTISEWFDTSCFTQPAVGTIGNDRTGNGNAYGPGLQNWDFSISKATPVWGENKQLKFEANFFNVFNHPNYSNPDTNVQDGNFGVVTSDNGQPREIQFGLKFLF